MEPVLLVGLGRGPAATLLGHAVHDHRAAEVLGRGEGLLDRVQVVPVDRADVLQPEVLEQALRGDEVLQALLRSVQRTVDRVTHHRGAAHGHLAPLQEPLVTAAGPQRGQVVGHPTGGRRVGPGVVVDHHDHRPVLGRRDVVQRLPTHPTGQRTITHHRHHGPVLTGLLVRLGQPVGPAQRRGGVRGLDDVVLGLGPARVARQATGLPQPTELGRPAGDDLVHVRLVAGVPHDPVPRRVEHPVQRQRQLHHAQVRTEVTTAAGDLGHEELADLPGELVQLRPGQPTQVHRLLDRVQQAHSLLLGRSMPASPRSVAGSNRTAVSGSRPSSGPVRVAAVAISTL